MIKDLKQLKNKAIEEIGQVKDFKSLDQLEIKYLGRKGELTKTLRGIKDLSDKEKPIIGKLANEIKKELVEKIEKVKKDLKISEEQKARFSEIDVSFPGRKIEIGHLHPITQFMRKVEDIFTSMGFEIITGPEVETEKYNFDLLNIPKDHPARDVWDTFFVNRGTKELKNTRTSGSKLLLRTHTSPMQLRAMEKRKPPVRIIVPGRVFRHEATDAGHETTFYQCEGLAIDYCIRVTDLIGTLKYFLQQIFGNKVKIRVRPEYYPFVEPGMDIDMSCLICGGKGCSVCKQSGWLEMVGSGMVHPKVLKNMNIDPNQFSGFAFGLGIDRLMMLYYGINDIRLSYSGDLRFLEQF